MKKISLLKDCFSKETFNRKATDEMVQSETNKIYFMGMTTLLGLLMIFGLLADIFDINSYLNCPFYITLSIFAIIGVVNYGMFIAFCKKGIVKHLGAWATLVWSLFTFPISIVTLFLPIIVPVNLLTITKLIAMVFIALILYFICNAIYKKSFDED